MVVKFFILPSPLEALNYTLTCALYFDQDLLMANRDLPVQFPILASSPKTSWSNQRQIYISDTPPYYCIIAHRTSPQKIAISVAAHQFISTTECSYHLITVWPIGLCPVDTKLPVTTFFLFFE